MYMIASTIVPKRISIYLFAFLIIQLMILFTTFEFIRKPWDGKELEVEKITQQQANNFFESISSMHTDDEFRNINDGATTEQGAQPSQKQTK